MKPQYEEAVKGSKKDVLLLGDSSWKPVERSLKYAWPDKNGKRARGGEIPLSAVAQAVIFAAKKGYLEREQMATIVKGLTDVLAEAP